MKKSKESGVTKGSGGAHWMALPRLRPGQGSSGSGDGWVLGGHTECEPL